MLMLYLTSGECIEIPEAESAERIENMLLCFDAQGLVVRALSLEDVSLYTSDPEKAALMLNELCEDEPRRDSEPEREDVH